MSVKTASFLTVKVIVLAILLSISFILGTFVSGMARMQPAAQPQVVTETTPGTTSAAAQPQPAATPAAPDPNKVLRMLLLACLLQALVVTHIILRSRWGGWKLVGAVFICFFGVNTLQPVIEAALYLSRRLPPSMVPRMFVMGAFTAALFSPLAVLILGKIRRGAEAEAPNPRLVMPLREWAWKAAVVGLAYLALYYTFGYFVAWQNPALRQYYGATELRSFPVHLAGIWSSTPWMFPYHAFRGLLFAAFVLPVIRMFKGRAWETGLAVGLAFSFLGGAQLLLPNPFMPEVVARMHLIECTSSTFIFGWVVGWLLSRHHSSVRDLFRWAEAV